MLEKNNIKIFCVSFVLLLLTIWSMLFCHYKWNNSHIVNLSGEEVDLTGCYTEDNKIIITDSKAVILFNTKKRLNHAVLDFEYNYALIKNPTVSMITSDGDVVEKTIDACGGQTEVELQGKMLSNISKIEIDNVVSNSVVLTAVIMRGNIFNIHNFVIIVLLVTILSFLIVLLINKVSKKSIYARRESNLELGRVICMLLLVGHHLSIHGNIWNMEYMGENRVFALLLIPIGKIAFVFFIACSCWFLVDKQFEAKRFFDIWIQGFFYSVLFTIIAKAFSDTDVTYSARSVIGTLFPILGNSHGFLSGYLSFYLLLPLLHIVSEKVQSKSVANYIVLLLLGLESFSQLIGTYVNHIQNLHSEVGVFILCYFISLRLKRWPLKIEQQQLSLLLIVITTWLLLWTARYQIAIHPDSFWINFVIATLTDESSITNIVAGFALFFFFKNLNIPKLPFINYLARGTLACLLIHDHEFFRYVIWKKFIRVSSMYYASHIHFLLCVAGTMIVVFAGSFVIERVRIILLEQRIHKTRIFENLCNRLDKLFY